MVFLVRTTLAMVALMMEAAAFRPTGGYNKRSHNSLRMALTPVGPFCPFRSKASTEQGLDEIAMYAPEINSDMSQEMTRLQADMAAGVTPEPSRLLRVADTIDASVDQWEALLDGLRKSSDFQTQECSKLTQAHNQGVSPKSIAAMRRWQGACMRAMANNTPPPMPPPELDLQSMLRNSEESRPAPSILAMDAAESITSSPFSPDSEIFKQPLIKSEYEQLCTDHEKMIELGANYAHFDPKGKELFIDVIEQIEDRWDVFFARFNLLGLLDEVFIAQCNQFLASMNMSEEDYRKLLKKAHELMREEAREEARKEH